MQCNARCVVVGGWVEVSYPRGVDGWFDICRVVDELSTVAINRLCVYCQVLWRLICDGCLINSPQPTVLSL
jgi:hypothetical protein